MGRIARAAVFAVGLLAAAQAQAQSQAEPPTPAQIEAARRAVLDDRFQAELPGYGSGSGADRGQAGRPGRRARGERGRDERPWIDARHHEEPRGLSSLMNVVLWVLLGALGAIGAVWLASELSRGAGDAASVPDAETHARMQAAVDAIIDRPLGDADEIAARGGYAEAIHTLLLRTLQELARSAAVRVAPAMTSREILARVPLLADARSALAGLITAVELTYFGDESASAADYERCRQQFHVFAAAFRGRQDRSQAVGA